MPYRKDPYKYENGVRVSVIVYMNRKRLIGFFGQEWDHMEDEYDFDIIHSRTGPPQLRKETRWGIPFEWISYLDPWDLDHLG